MKTLSTDEILFENYWIRGPVGEGTNGIVYAAIDRRDNREVAIKHYARGRGPLSEGVVELSQILQINHPNVVNCVDFYYGGDGETYLMYEHVGGGSLRDMMDRWQDDWSTHSLFEMLCQILSGLEAIHSAEIIHSDLKPENVLVDWSYGDGPRYKITDLGTAIHAPSGTIKDRIPRGSPAYMAPERFYDSYGFNADLYALGVILYECLCGELPFLGSVSQIAFKHLNEHPNLESIRKQCWAPIVYGLLEKNVSRRLSKVSDVLFVLETCLNGREERRNPTVYIRSGDEYKEPKYVEEPGEIQTYGFGGGVNLSPPGVLEDYKQVAMFSVRGGMIEGYAYGSSDAPGLLAVYPTFLARIYGVTGGVQGLLMAGNGETTMPGPRGEFVFVGSEKLIAWMPNENGCVTMVEEEIRLCQLAAGSSARRWCGEDGRRLLVVEDSEELLRMTLPVIGLTKGIYLQKDGSILLVVGNAPSRLIWLSRSGNIEEEIQLPGIVLSCSKFPDFQCILLGKEEGGNGSRSADGLWLARWDGGLKWYRLPRDVRQFSFHRSGLLWMEEGKDIFFCDLAGQTHRMGRLETLPENLIFSDDGRFYFLSARMPDNSLSVKLFTQEKCA